MYVLVQAVVNHKTVDDLTSIQFNADISSDDTVDDDLNNSIVMVESCGQ